MTRRPWVMPTALLILSAAVIGLGAGLASKSLEIERLREEVASLRQGRRPPGESQHSTARGGPTTPGNSLSHKEDSHDWEIERATLNERITQLEAEIRRRDQRDQAMLATLRKPLLVGGHPVDKSDLPAVKTKILDPSAPPEERISALGILRDTDPSARTPEIVQSMTGLLDTLSDPQCRADICRYLRGVVDEGFKRSLLNVVRLDPTPVVREKAVECLGSMKDDPIVRLSIQEVIESDSSEKVKLKAQQTLSGGK